MKKTILNTLILAFVLGSCTNSEVDNSEKETTLEFQNEGHELVYNMVQTVGDFELLSSKKDVVYTYTYETPDGKKDISTEKYIFNEELSYGAYNLHQRTLPELNGLIEQGYDGSDFWLKHQGQYLEDTTALKKVAFNRPTNYYWFTMMQKLLDPGINYELVGEKTIENKDYDIVKISFQSNDDKPTDIYQLYINKKTALVDQFLFTVADFGKMDPSLMVLEYEEVDGMMIPTKRKYKKSNWDADVNSDPWVTVNWTNIKFNNNLKAENFKRI